MTAPQTPPTTSRRALGITRSRRRRPGTVMVVVGVLLVAIGAFVAGRSGRSDAGSGDAASSDPGKTSATAESSAPSSAPSSDPTDPSDGSDEHLTAARVAPAIAVPDGHDGVAVTLPFTAAGGGYVGAGDLVNVYVGGEGGTSPAAALLRSVTVLDVSIEVAPRVVTGTAERPSGGQITYLLAIPEGQVGDLVSAAQSTSASLYVSLVAGSGVAEQPSGDAGTER